MPSTAMHHTTPVVAFEPDSGLLGAGTNGAMPQPALGLLVEAEVYPDAQRPGEPLEGYWIKVMTSRDGKDGKPAFDHLSYSGDIRKVERIMSAVVDAGFRGAAPGALGGDFDCYRNSSQLDFDASATDECIGGAECRVARAGEPGEGGFELSFHDRADGSTLARLGARLSPKATMELSTAMAALKEFRAAALKQFKAGAPAPRLPG